MPRAAFQLRDVATKKSMGGHIFVAPDEISLQASIDAYSFGSGVETAKVKGEADIQPIDDTFLPSVDKAL